MTRRIAILAVLLLSACVGTHQQGLTAGEKAEIRRYVPDAQLENLTLSRQLMLSNTLTHGDGLNMAQDLRAVLMLD